MNENIKQTVDTNSAEFKEGVQAGLNSAVNTKNWKAGNELGQELKEDQIREPVNKNPFNQPSVPLFLRDRSEEGNKGNPEDEKDETEE